MKSVRVKQFERSKGLPAITTQIINFGKILKTQPTKSEEFFHLGTRLEVVNAKIKSAYPNSVPKQLQVERASLQARLRPIEASIGKKRVKALKRRITRFVTKSGLAKAA